MDATCLVEAIRESIFKESEEGIDRGEASVPRPVSIAAVGFEMIEKGEDEVRVDLFHRKRGWRRGKAFGGEDDEQLEGRRPDVLGIGASQI